MHSQNSEIEPRKDFYDPNIDMNRVYYYVEVLAKNCSFSEICKIFREIAYDQVRYDNEKQCSIIYRSDKYSRLGIEQANRFYNQSRTILDLFAQCISGKREFNEDYLKAYDFAGPYIRTIENLNAKIEAMEEEINYLKYGDDSND